MDVWLFKTDVAVALGHDDDKSWVIVLMELLTTFAFMLVQFVNYTTPIVGVSTFI